MPPRNRHQLPQLPSYTIDQLWELHAWLASCEEDMQHSRRRMMEAFRATPLPSLENNARYYSNAASTFRYAQSQLEREIARHRKNGEVATDGAGPDADVG